MIGVDPHKASWTAVAVDGRHQPLAAIRVDVSRDGYRRLRRFAHRFPQARWAIEGARGLGAPLTERLRADGVEVLDVPAKLARKVRMLSTGHGRKSDEADALSVAVAALTAHRLTTAEIDEAIAALRALIEHRDDLVRTRTQTTNRLHAVLTQLIPAGHRRGLTADGATRALRSIRPRATLGRTLRRLAVELVADLRRLDRRIEAVTEELGTAVEASGSTLTNVYRVGPVVAAKLLARAGSMSRFRSADAFASYAGVAPIEVSPGDVVRHRLSRAGDRQLNYALHLIAITQIRRETAGKTYYEGKRAAGKSHKEALRLSALT
ncbi:IS110 family transposase [Hamadaea sp. NPDC051192]|uniref:IS110 family transposase n=1 Tax=Hamadaea sp. NPDC051192 TaxID=3154940 RepID=UPI003422D99A